jgi:hypothetical protein
LPFAVFVCVAALPTTHAFASEQPPAATLASDAQIDISPTPPEPRLLDRVSAPDLQEAPPPRPRHHGLVLESTIGVLGFAGPFRHVAPPAYWMHTQLGYEALAWLMLFAEAELAFTDTSEAEDASHSRAFPIWGLGGGARATAHLSAPVAGFVQGEVGALTAYVPHGALAYLGFRDAESLGAQFGGRVGLEWYAKDRHLALCLEGGPRIAQGFSKFASSGLPLMWDTAAGVRYTF